MKKFLLLWLPITLAGVAVIFFSLKLTSLDSASAPGELNAGAELEGVAGVAEGYAARDVERGGAAGQDTDGAHVSHFPDVPSSQARVLKEVFDYSLSLVEGFETIAVEGAWDYDKMINNLALWEFLCEAGNSQMTAFLGEDRDTRLLLENVARLCSGYDAKRQEVDEYQVVEIREHMEGVNQRAALENTLNELGPDRATIAAVAEISRALDESDYYGVVGALWFLGNYYFDGVSEELAVYSRRPNVETMYAVSSSIFCSSIGGCDGSHPVTLNLCVMFVWLPCNRRPVNIHDAIDQILTGAQLEVFNEMNPALVDLLNRYRAGNL